ncbi:hypothetical protein PC118_g19037 [Phytophthora cactorum]|uniref:Uncharacterized protein n=1 Tax=Phytophthora cactorum TaxID=29920 RepID=A0A8T1F1Y0_9STRA|nr:hypothetical protein PC118_g19037 [Phytophthora cactorum]
MMLEENRLDFASRAASVPFNFPTCANSTASLASLANPANPTAVPIHVIVVLPQHQERSEVVSPICGQDMGLADSLETH